MLKKNVSFAVFKALILAMVTFGMVFGFGVAYAEDPVPVPVITCL